MRKLLLPLLFLCVLTGTVGAQADSGEIVGLVTTSEDPAAGVSVRALAPQQEQLKQVDMSTTDDSGDYHFTGLPPGTLLLELEYRGMRSTSVVSVDDNPTTVQRVDFNLTGSIQGTVSKSDVAVGGVPVHLRDAYGMTLGNTTADSNGKYHFENVKVGEAYVVAVEYDDAEYTERVSLAKIPRGIVDVRVYNATDSDAGIVVEMDHVVVTQGNGGLEFTEMLSFKNTGGKTYGSSEGTWLRIPLPANAQNVQTEVMDCCVRITQDSVRVDAMSPLPPNATYQTRLSYTVPTDGEYQYERGMAYNTSNFIMLVSKSSQITVEPGEGFAGMTEQTMGQANYNLASSTNLERGEVVYATFNTPTTGDGISSYAWALAAIGLVAAFIAYPLIKKHSPARPSMPEDENAKRQAIQTVLNQINRDYEAGELSEEEYEYLREKYRAKLENLEDEDKEPSAEEQAIQTVLNQINRDYEAGELSEEEYEYLREKYQGRLGGSGEDE